MSSAKPHRRSLFTDKLAEYAHIASDEAAVFSQRGQWRSFFASRIGASFDGRLTLEIGCADASLLIAMAARRPAGGFIGLDWKTRQILLAAQLIASRDQHNITLLRTRAQLLPQMFSDGEVDEIVVFHPEPCDRPEEAQNRLIALPFLTAAHAVLADGGSISIKTDHVGYYQWVLALFGIAEPDWSESIGPTRVRTRDMLAGEQLPPASEASQCLFDVSLQSRDYWHDAAALARTASRCFAGETTTFENRFIKKRQPIFYIELAKR